MDNRSTNYADRPDMVAAQLQIFASELADEHQANRRALRELREAYRAFALQYALIIEGNDAETRRHLDRTRSYAMAVAKRLRLEHLEELELGFLLHDIGKWTVPPQIIKKPGPLTDAEWRIMRTHPAAGALMVADIPMLRERPSDVIRSHHERWDGKGYPHGLAGTDIPIAARVFSVADVFDALTSDRPYREAMTFEEALRLIVADRATAFDPDVVDEFMAFAEEHLLSRHTIS